MVGHATGTKGSDAGETLAGLMRRMSVERVTEIVSADDGDRGNREAEERALERSGLGGVEKVRTKVGMGNLYAGAAAAQVVLGAVMAERGGRGHRVVANCMGMGNVAGTFVLEGT